MYDKADLLSTLINQIFPCIACNNHRNINNFTTWVPVFLRKLGDTTWEVFDINIKEMGPELEWDSNEGLKNLWGLYYKCPSAESIQRIRGTQMDKGPSRQKAVQQQEDAGSLQHAPSSFSTKTTNTQAPDDVTATATTFSSSGTSLFTGTYISSNTQASDTLNAEPQTALEKHMDDVVALIPDWYWTVHNS